MKNGMMKIKPSREPAFQDNILGNHPDDYDPSLNGLSGLLGLVVFGQILSIAIGLWSIYQVSSLFGINDLNNGYATYNIVGSAASIGMNALVLYLMFKRNIKFRKTFIISAIINVVWTIGLYSVFGKYLDPSAAASFNILPIIIWTVYLYKSKRVRNTFIYPFIDFTQEM